MQTKCLSVFPFLKNGLPIIVAMMSFAMISGCYKSTAKRELPPPLVYVAQAEQRNVQLYKDYTGKTEACETVNIPARVQGYLEKMTFKPGQFVKQGDPLFVIEQTQYQANAQQAEADLAKAKADLDYMKSDYERTVELYEASKAMTLSDVQDRTRNYERAKAAVESAEAVLIEAKLKLSYTEITAPIDGLISRNLVDVGNLVSDVSTALTPLATINKMDPIYVYVEISDSDFYHFTELHGKGDSPWPFTAQLVREDDDTFSTRDGDLFPFQGVLNYIGNTINPMMGSITIRGEIPNPEHAIYPGTVCHIKVPSRTMPDAIVVYERAVVKDLSNYYMLVINKENKVEHRLVEKGPSVNSDCCVVLSGLEPGESYIVEGLQKARVNQPVDAKPYQPKNNYPVNDNPRCH